MRGRSKSEELGRRPFALEQAIKKSHWRLRSLDEGVVFSMFLHFFILAVFSILALSCVVAPFLKPLP